MVRMITILKMLDKIDKIKVIIKWIRMKFRRQKRWIIREKIKEIQTRYNQNLK